MSEIMKVGINLLEYFDDEPLLKRWINEKGQLEFDEGYHKYNPNNVKCPNPECQSSDIEFLWNNGRVVGLFCNICNYQELDK